MATLALICVTAATESLLIWWGVGAGIIFLLLGFEQAELELLLSLTKGSMISFCFGLVF